MDYYYWLNAACFFTMGLGVADFVIGLPIEINKKRDSGSKQSGNNAG